jgi:hypothetical protein
MNLLPKLLDSFRSVAARFTDKRSGERKPRYEMADLFMAAFSPFFMQSPSFLSYQRNLEKGHTTNNCAALFGMEKIPSDNHIRDMLDEVSPQELQPCFDDCLQELREHGGLASFAVLGDRTAIALDGTEYFNSEKIDCPCCQHRTHGNGKTEYYHAMLCATLVAPGHDQAFPLMPEFITPQDGHDKQDCERAAAKRWLAAHHDRARDLRPVYLGDAMFACQSLCKTITGLGADFLFTCKPGSHKSLYALVDGMQRQKREIKTPARGKRPATTTRYEWITGLPLCQGDDALRVNWGRISIIAPDGTVRYKHDFITSLPIAKDNIVEIAACSRARWKIENETFNVLKNNGYHLEHNFGHGQKNLAMIFAATNLLAFAAHTLMDCCNERWKAVRKYEGSRRDFFGAISHATRFLIFPSWESLWATMLDKDKTPSQKQFENLTNA